MMGDHRSQEEYIRQVLEAYRKTPGTMGTLRRPDRLLAPQLYQLGVSVAVIEKALVLAATRRLMRPANLIVALNVVVMMSPLAAIHSADPVSVKFAKCRQNHRRHRQIHP